MKTIKIEKEVTKEDVFVCVANTSEYDEVYRIITAGGEQILKLPYERLIAYSPIGGYWVAVGSVRDKYQITIPQIAELLGVEYPLKPEQLPTLEELIAEAKSKITVKSETYPCWVEGMREIKTYHIGGMSHTSEKSAIAAYISKKIQEEYL